MDTITARITTQWLKAAREQLEQALRDDRPLSIAAAKAALDEVLIVVEQARTDEKVPA